MISRYQTVNIEKPKTEVDDTIHESSGSRIPFYLLICFLAFEYARIHAIFPPVKILHLPLVTILILCFFIAKDKPNFESFQTKFFLLLIILMAFHVPIARNNYWAFQTTKTMFAYLVFNIATVMYVRSYKMLEKLILIMVLCGIFLSIQGIYHGGLIKGSAFYSDENDFALAMNLLLPLAYFVFVIRRQKTIVTLAAAVLFLIANLISFSRGGFVGLCIVLLFLWLKSKRKLVTTLFLASLVLLVLFAAPTKYWEEMRTIREEGTKRGTGAARMYYWKVAWKMFLDNPVFGVGPGNYPWNIERYEPPEGFRGRTHGGRVSHSLYFTLLSELGLVGCLIFAMISIANFKVLSRMTKIRKLIDKNKAPYEGEAPPTTNDLLAGIGLHHVATGIYVAFIGYLASGAFLSVLYYPHFWILTGITTAMGQLEKEGRLNEAEPAPSLQNRG
jgi:probable O-glycosylation ligase (exosortase A-associated)